MVDAGLCAQTRGNAEGPERLSYPHCYFTDGETDLGKDGVFTIYLGCLDSGLVVQRLLLFP